MSRVSGFPSHQNEHTAPRRGQTEPLAALVAVSLVCVAISVYAGFVTGLVPEIESDRERATVTSERIWSEIGEDGIYPAETSLQETISPETLPHGQSVYSNVTSIGDEGFVVEHSSAGFDEDGTPIGMCPPEDGERYERPVPVQHRDGDIRPGLLTVVVVDTAKEGTAE